MTRLGMGRRALAVVVAVVLAAVAAFALLSYVRGVESQALADVEQVDVLVAKEMLPAGTSVAAASEEGLITRDRVARKLAPDGAVSSLDELAGRVAAVDIVAGEALVAGRFVAQNEAPGVFEIPEGHHAMSVQVDVPPGVAGFVDPGDTVSILASTEEQPPAGEDEEVAASAAGPRVRFLLQNVPVLSAGQRVVTETQENEDGEAVERSSQQVLLTLAVNPEQAERLGYAVIHGEVYFTLVPHDADVARTSGVDLEELYDS